MLDDSVIELKVLRNTVTNLDVLKKIAEQTPSKEYHILIGQTRIALITHYLWEECDYCNWEYDEDGVIELIN